MDVFSICTDWKIWLLFPPTKSNLSLMQKNGNFQSKLLRLHQDLEGGSYAITRQGEGLYLPTGYLHATYALESSFTIGTVGSSAEGLPATTDILVASLYPNHEAPVSAEDVICFLQSLVQAFSWFQYTECQSAMQKICSKKLGITDKQGPLLGPGWGLKGSKSVRSTLESMYKIVRSCVVTSRMPEEFWLCNESECGPVLEHIY
jgi:hypothetical protein